MRLVPSKNRFEPQAFNDWKTRRGSTEMVFVLRGGLMFEEIASSPRSRHLHLVHVQVYSLEELSAYSTSGSSHTCPGRKCRG